MTTINRKKIDDINDTINDLLKERAKLLAREFPTGTRVQWDRNGTHYGHVSSSWDFDGWRPPIVVVNEKTGKASRLCVFGNRVERL